MILLLFATPFGCLARNEATGPDDRWQASSEGDTDDSSAEADTNPTDSGPTDSAPSDGETGDSGETYHPATPGRRIVYDCAALPEMPTLDTEMDTPLGYHDVAFDDRGHLLGWDQRSALIHSHHNGTLEPLSPGFEDVQGIDRLWDGDYVVADDQNNCLWRVNAEGLRSVLASGILSPYGVTVGPDGNVYAGTVNELIRVDPATGEHTTLLELTLPNRARAVAFSLDNRTMYVATAFPGSVLAVPLDATLTPTGPAVTLVEDLGGAWQDAIGIDACGNLYVAEFYSSGLYKITPEGTVTTLYAGTQRTYGHGFDWGSGLGGWRADAIYLAQPYDANSIRELVIGVPSGNSVRTWP